MRSNRSNYDNEEDVNNDEEDNDNKSSGVVVISGGGGGGGTTVVSESESENENENENDSENTVPRHDSGNSLLWRIVTKIMSWCYYTHLVTSEDPQHPANLICELCRKFYGLGWVTGTGGGISIRRNDHIFIAPSGVQKELMKPADIFVMDAKSLTYLREPRSHKPSACTRLFLAAFDRGAGACIHTHSQWAVLVTLLVERQSRTTTAKRSEDAVFEIELLEQIKGIGRGRGKDGNLGFRDRLRVPIIENTAKEEDLTESLEAAMNKYPDTYAVLVQRHGIYVWGDTVSKAKTQCESLDYIFQLAVEMTKLGIPWVQE